MEAILITAGFGCFFGSIAGLIKPQWVRLKSRGQAGLLLLFSTIPITASAEFYPAKDTAPTPGATVSWVLLFAFAWWVRKLFRTKLRNIEAAETKADQMPSSSVSKRSAAEMDERRRKGEAFIKRLGERRALAPVRSAPVNLGAVQTAARDMRVTPRIPAKRTPRVEAVVVDPVVKPVRDHSSGWAGYISYIDAKGESSERRIVVKRVEGYGKAESIQAYCCEREASRRFLISGIQELACAETGEILDPRKHFDLLASEGAIGVADKSLADLITILVFLARCDGEFHALEMECLNGAILEHMMSFGGDPKDGRKAARKARELAPDAEDFTAALYRLNRHPKRRQLAAIILDAAEEIVEADGIVTRDEEEFFDLVFDALDHMAAK